MHRMALRVFALRSPALLRTALLCVTLLCTALLTGCAQFGVPQLPAAYRDPAGQHAAVLLAYDPETVLGFGHTGILVREEDGDYSRYDQYASAELAYEERLREGSAHFWEAATARLPSIFGFTREVVLRRRGAGPAALVAAGEELVPLPGLDPAPIREAAERRWRNADGLERDSAPRYVWLLNNCHHFVRDVLRTGGTIPEAYFPKHWVEDAIAELPAG